MSNPKSIVDLANLPGVRLIRVSEPHGDLRFNEDLIKQLTGGDPIRTRVSRRDLADMGNATRLIASAEQRPFDLNVAGRRWKSWDGRRWRYASCMSGLWAELKRAVRKLRRERDRRPWLIWDGERWTRSYPSHLARWACLLNRAAWLLKRRSLRR